MLNNTKSRRIANFEAFAKECKAKGDRWKRSLAIAGAAGHNIEQLRPRNTTPALEAAMGYAIFRGWKTFPANLEDGGKKSYLSAEHAPGGEPWGMTGDPDLLRRNFVNDKWRLLCGVGVPTGPVNGIIVIEGDTVKGHNVDGLKSLEELQARHGKLPDTLMAESPSGSPHRYYRHPGRGSKIKSCTIAPGVDVKADGGMVIAPPSVRSDGVYRWLNNLPIADAPDWLIELVRDDAPAKSDGGRKNDPWENVYKPLDDPEITAGCEAIRDHLPNPANLDWAGWNRVGMILAFVACDERGREAFHGFSKRWGKGKYNATATDEK